MIDIKRLSTVQMLLLINFSSRNGSKKMKVHKDGMIKKFMAKWFSNCENMKTNSVFIKRVFHCMNKNTIKY